MMGVITARESVRPARSETSTQRETQAAHETDAVSAGGGDGGGGDGGDGGD